MIRDSLHRWNLRKKNKFPRGTGLDKITHSLKYAPHSLIKYSNLMNKICPLCPKVRCSAKHLSNFHNLKIPSVEELVESFHFLGPDLKSGADGVKRSRQWIINHFESKIKIPYDKLFCFINGNQLN